MAPRGGWAAGLLLLLAMAAASEAFYLPGVAPQDFKKVGLGVVVGGVSR